MSVCLPNLRERVCTMGRKEEEGSKHAVSATKSNSNGMFLSSIFISFVSTHFQK
jgi:hypothetical protein